MGKREKFPKGVIFILWNIFIDRFSSGGILVILAIFLHQKLNYDTNTATAIYHINEFLLYLFSIVGAVLADSWLGMYKTLVSMTVLSAISVSIIAFASLDFHYFPIHEASVIGLIAAMIGIGSVKPNQNVFGGNQFKLPEQAELLDYYFSMHYLVLKCGQVGGMILVPILREDVSCFGSNDCYPLAFGVPAILMVFCVIILWIGRNSFIHMPPNGNALMQVLGCIKHAVNMKIFSKPSENQKISHWLDYSKEKYGAKLVADTKAVLNILIIYIPLPIYWALLSQQSSRWVFQATRMNGDIGWYTIKADQVMVMGPLLITVLIPIFNKVFFPLLAKVGIKSPLQRMLCGMVCVGISFIVTAFVETVITHKYISILWLFPQYFLAAISEILLWVAIVAFAYTQAPQSMKSVMTASVYLTVAGGSLIIFLISSLKLFESQTSEFIFYASLMFADMIVFGLLAKRYKYIDTEDIDAKQEGA